MRSLAEMKELAGGCWAPLRRHHRDDDQNDWVNLRQAIGLRVVDQGGRYRIAAEFPAGIVVTDLMDETSYGSALSELADLVRALR